MKWKYLNLSLSFLSGLLISFLISSSHAQTITDYFTNPNSSSTISEKTVITNQIIWDSLIDLKKGFNDFKLTQYQANRDLEKICGR